MTSTATGKASRAGSAICSDLVLALNGAEDRLQFALGERRDQGVKHLHAQEWTVPGKAMQHLAPALDNALKQLGSEPRAITAIACVRGPGSFTGLRLTLATALGLSRALNAPLAGMDYLPLLAATPAATLAACSAATCGGSIWVLTHARREQVYVQGFTPAEIDSALLPLPLSPPRAAMLAELPALFEQAPRPVSILGSGLRRNQAPIESLLQGLDFVRFLPQHLDHPTPSLLLGCAAGLTYGREPIEPLYIRASDAEENLAAIARGRGLSLDQAQRILDSSSE